MGYRAAGVPLIQPFGAEGGDPQKTFRLLPEGPGKMPDAASLKVAVIDFSPGDLAVRKLPASGFGVFSLAKVAEKEDLFITLGRLVSPGIPEFKIRKEGQVFISHDPESEGRFLRTGVFEKTDRKSVLMDGLQLERRVTDTKIGISIKTKKTSSRINSRYKGNVIGNTQN
jgi:hypothetical protein